MDISKRDWKLFQENIGDWQESYIEKLNAEYIKILEGVGNPSEKFWQLEKRIKADKKHCGVLIEMRKQNLPFDLVSLIKEGVIGFENIGIFSNDLQVVVRFLTERN